MNRKVCLCCGQTLPVEVPFMEAGLSPQQFILVARVFAAGKHGVAREQLFNFIYDADPNGGPLTGVKTMHVQKCQCNKKLKKVGLQIKLEHRVYKLIELPLS